MSCQDACTNYLGCNFYTYDADTQTCFMFDTCPELDVSCGSCASGSPGCDLSDNDIGNLAYLKMFEQLTKTTTFVGYFIMSIGGYDGSTLSDVELTSLDPDIYPVPDCLTDLNPLPYAVDCPFAALDYSRKSDF